MKNFGKNYNFNLVEDKPRAGFTLIEMITVTAIIAVLSVMVASNYHQGNRQVVLDMQASRFAQDLRRVQEWALAAHQVGGTAKNGYGIYLSQGSSSYIVYLDDGANGGSIVPGNGQYDSGFDTVQETIPLDSNVEAVLCNPNPASIDYMVPDPTTRINGVDSQPVQQVDFRVKGTSLVRSVIANKAGLIYVK